MFGRRRRAPSDFSQELQAHLELEMDRLRAEGLTEQQAYHAARRNLGNLATAGEHFYESSRCLWLEHLGQETRHAWRRLRKAPAFTITATLTLALGIGATTSIFTLVHAVLLKSLPVSNPDRLYRLGKKTHCCVWGAYSQDDEISIVSYDLYKHFRDNTKGFEELAAFQAGGARLGVRRAQSRNAAESFPGEYVSGNYFAMFGLSAYAGRTLTMADDQPGAAPTAVMSYRLWREKYAGDPSVVGGVFSLNDKPFTVVGVAPPGFFGDSLKSRPPEFFLPLATEPLLQGDSSLRRHVDTAWLDLIGRARAGATAGSIESQMRVELQQWLQAHIGDMDSNQRAVLPKQTLYLSPGGAGITGMRENYEQWLQMLMLVSGFVLLIVCANVGNLMLVRGMERRQQTSLSMALGARPWRLLLPALTESLVLALLGGAAGLGVAFAGTRLILHLAFPNAAALPIDASPSIPVLLFAFGVSLITGVAFGILPAWMTTRVDPVEALRGANRATRRAGSLPRKTLAIVQAALSLVLLSTSGLLTAALRHLEHQDFGFEQDGRTVVALDPVLAGYKPAQLDMLYRQIRDSVMSIPGVSSVASCLYSPQNGDSWNDRIVVAGRPAPGPQDDNGASWDRVTAGYFETVGNPILKGRPITERDTAASPHVAVINQAFARKFFRNQDPIGKHFGRTDIQTAGEYEVVGVAKDARYQNFYLQKPVGAFFLLPESQSTTFAKETFNVGEARSHYLHDVVVRTQPGVKLQESQVRRAFAAVDPNLPVVGVRSLSDQVASTFNQQRLIARLTSLFGVLALVLASIGLYGVTAYNAGSRTNEIGVRMALGADRGNVLALILRGALVQIALGLALGIPLTVAAGGFLGNQLYGINQHDPRVITIAILALGFSGLIAALIPAIRASSLAPVKALRAE
jgi:predicted permease